MRAVVGHARQIENADLSVPVILACDGQVLDGMHRLAKAVLGGRSSVPAQRLPPIRMQIGTCRKRSRDEPAWRYPARGAMTHLCDVSDLRCSSPEPRHVKVAEVDYSCCVKPSCCST